MSTEEIITSVIDREATLAILADLIPAIAAAWGSPISGEHGGVSRVDTNEQWQPTLFPTETLIDHLLNEETKGNFAVSQWDYWLHDRAGTSTIQLCHESDLHFDVEEGELRVRVLAVLAARGVHHHPPKNAPDQSKG
jgi:hypothetical protein